ncbi:hypothetical protein BJ165DRAFT_1615763 [Panaeolus papilionaceus]|nr:hypothetical protein BJ165DRAFT_1615763 [Panaeolus papilionaceus]
MAAAQEYGILRFNGPLSVIPVTPEEVKGKRLWVNLLMGPTGSGKSAFIQALSADHDLSISKDTLESVTQNVTCYQVVNLSNTWDLTYILMDTPGLLDPKLSESRITKMIKEKLDDLRKTHKSISVAILYFQPITDIRIGRSKGGAVKLVRAFAGSFHALGIVVATTMWNCISTAQQIADANCRFSCLENEIFATSLELRIQVTKFKFSRGSALSILDMPSIGWAHDEVLLQNVDLQYQPIICNNLLERISNAQQQLHSLEGDRCHASRPGKEDPLLLGVVLMDERAVLSALQSFLDDLYEIDPQSCSSPFPQKNSPQAESPPTTKSLRSHLKTMTILSFKKIFRKTP